MGELVTARMVASVSQQTLADSLGWTQAAVSRFERLVRPDAISVTDVATVAAVLGLELGAGLYPAGDPIRDKGHQALLARFRKIAGAAWRIAAEVPFPTHGDPRTWDLVLRIAGQIVGVEAETRIRDVQAIARRIHQREGSGGANVIVVVLADTSTNRRLVNQLREALGEHYQTPPRDLLKALRQGQPLPGSGVVLL